MDQMGGFQMSPSLIPPHLTNQPPQIFGQYLPDGVPNMHQLPPDYAAHMFTDSHLLMDDSTEAKRRRISRACDMCRKKKIKCDGKLPACTHCINYKTDCVFTQVEKKRAPPKGAKYIEGLENRLGRMHHLLKLSGLLDDDEDDLGALEKRLTEKTRQASMAHSSSPSTPSHVPSVHERIGSPNSPSASPGIQKDREKEKNDKMDASSPGGDQEEPVEALSEMMCSLVTNQSGDSRYIGSSSGFSIFSPKGVQWINAKTGSNTFENMISQVSEDDHKWTNWKPDVFNDLFRRPIFRPLPSKEEALSLLKDFFENFNCMLPLYHEPTFMHLVERQYSSEPYQGSGWWASLNVVFALTHRLRVMSHVVPAEEDEKAWGYIKNAMGVFSELSMRNTDLLSVQALLGIALFMQGTPNPQPAILLVATAIRLAHSIGLHKRVTGFNLNPVEIEQRKRVFWIAYMLDKDLGLRSGRPPAQDDDDMNVDLPDEDPPDNIGNIPLADGKGKMNLFRVMCEFATIQSKVYKRLYSAKASKQTDGEILNTIGELDSELEEWKDKIPLEFRPEQPINASHSPLMLHIVMLHFAYYNCLTTIHRMSIHHGLWSSRLSNYAFQGLNVRPLNPRVYTSSVLCAAAARASISLLNYIPKGDFSCVWMVLYFPVSALVTLFGNVLQNPLEPTAKADAKLMDLVVSFLSTLGPEAEQGGVHRMLGVCSEFCNITKSVIEKAEKDHASRRKRKNHDGTSKTAVPATSNNKSPAPNPSPLAARRKSVPGHLNSPDQMKVGSRTGAQQLSPPPMSGSIYGGTFTNHPSPMSDSSPPMHSMAMSQDYQVPPENDWDAFQDMNGFGGDMRSNSISSFYQQPLLPPDLFALPMNLDWNWAEMSGGAYPTVENGNFGDFSQPLSMHDPQHHPQLHQPGPQ